MSQEQDKRPASIGDLLSVMMAAKPDFKPCTECAAPTTGGGLCWECSEKRARAQRAHELGESCIPRRFAWSRLSSPVLASRCKGGEPAIAKTRGDLGQDQLVFIGPGGSGKTSLAVAAMRAWIEQKLLPAKLVSCIELVNARRKEKLGTEAADVLEALHVPLLVLDDLGSEPQTELSPIPEIIWARHADCRPTWVTTWMTVPAMRSRFGEGLARRIFEGATVIDCSARST